MEIVKHAIAAYGSRDYETMRELSHPEMELDWSASLGLEARVYQGREQVLKFYEHYLDTFEEIDIQPDCFIESGDWVVVPNTTLVRGRDGIQTIARSAFAFELHGGLITRIRLYQETQEALEAVGLREWAMSQENPQQVIQGMYDAYNSDGLKAAGSFLHPQVEYRDDPRWPGGGVHQGRDAVIARFQEVIDALGLQGARLHRVVEARGQTVWVVAYFGQSSGAGVPNDPPVGVCRSHRRRSTRRL